MIKKRILTIIVFILIVICCVFEAISIHNLQTDRDEMLESVTKMQSQIAEQDTVMSTLQSQIDKKANEPMIRFYLPDDIYVCEMTGGNIYNNSVVYGINLNSYAFHWESGIGNSRVDRFEIAPMTKAGNYEVTLKIYDLELNELASKTTTLHIVKEEEATDHVLRPLIYSELPGEIPANLPSSFYDNEDFSENPNVAVVFPSAYEKYADLDGTMGAIDKVISDIRKDYKDIPILVVEPAYPGNKEDEEVRLENGDMEEQRWAYAEKTMVFRLISDLEKTYIDDDSVWIVPNALLSYSESDTDKIGDAINGVICHLIDIKQIKVEE